MFTRHVIITSVFPSTFRRSCSILLNRSIFNYPCSVFHSFSQLISQSVSQSVRQAGRQLEISQLVS